MGLLALVASALLLIPSAGYHLFNGIPLGSPAELGLLLLLLPFLVSGHLRRLWARVLRRARPSAPVVLMASGLCAVALKCLLFTFGGYSGFPACYHALDQRPVTGSCEKAYANPWYRFSVTRIDRTIDFSAWWDQVQPPTTANWNLSFLNSIRFNYYGNGSIPRTRVPFGAMWSGALNTPEPQTLRITYAGEGSLQIGDRSIPLPPHYGSLDTVAVPLSAGRHQMFLSYRFDDGSRVDDGVQHGPYATLRVRTGPRGDPLTSSQPLAAESPPVTWRIAGRVVDLIAIGFALSLVSVYLTLLGKSSLIGLAGCFLAPIAAQQFPVPAFFVRDLSVYLIIAVVALVGAVVLPRRHRRRMLLLAWCGVVLLMASDTLREWPRLDTVHLRDGGGDWLMYQSLARSVLDTWSLQGGRDVFYFQPMFRYIVFAEHMLLGDGDAGIVILARSGVSIAILWMCWLFTPRGLPRTWRGAVAGATAVLLMLFVNFSSVVRFFYAGASEYPTWIIFPVALSMLFAAPLNRWRIVGCALLGLAFTIRANQAPALLCLLGAYLLWARTRGPSHLIWSISAMLAVASLPMIHNFYYGGELVLTTTSATIPQNLIVSPAQVIAAASDADSRAVIRRQLDGVLQIGAARAQRMVQGADMLPAVRALQALWLLAIATTFTAGKRAGGIPRIVLLVPGLFLGVHLFYQVWVYYPRHIVIGYLAMGAVTFVAMCGRRLGGATDVIARVAVTRPNCIVEGNGGVDETRTRDLLRDRQAF